MMEKAMTMPALLNKKQIAERLGTSPGIASRLLAEKGVKPIDFGRGRCRGLRWYSAAVEAVILQMHEDAQDKTTKERKTPVRVPKPGLILGRSINDLYAELTREHKIQ